MNPQPSTLNLHSSRARKARLASILGAGVNGVLMIFAAMLFAIGLYCVLIGDLARLGYASLGVASLMSIIMLWYRYDLRHLHIIRPARTLDDQLDPTLLASLKTPITPRSAWETALKQSQARFLSNHLLLDIHTISGRLSDQTSAMDAIWQQATKLAGQKGRPELHAGTLAAAILLTAPEIQPLLTAFKITHEDTLEALDWLERQLAYTHRPRPYYGGIGRDWATGFTPTLERFGENISRSIEAHGSAPYMSHADLLDGIVSSLAGNGGVALVGPDGTGKSTLVDGLAERLLAGRDPSLQYYQIVSLNASLILSNSGAQLERLMLTLFGEAVTAGNIILFLDDAHLFFGGGVGAFDMSQVLQPILKNRRLKIIAAFTPTDWQQLQAEQSSLTTTLASFAVTEPPEAATMKIAEDNAMLLEYHSKTLVSLAAIREAYRLSGQYMQEHAYPGKVITLLEQAVPYAGQHRIITPGSVQAAVEKTKGVRVSAAQAPEADMLLHLEDRIHERMINQKRAVTVVASALRRGRAGVSNPKRPVGSFLFLGPTGVGKTELARSLAAVYYGDEQHMIRLDMSEYQRPDDVSRLLATGNRQDRSLLLAIREQPFSVVLLDEIEKAHPSVLNLLLQMLDEGQLTDDQGRPASFRSSIIIATSNAGAADITAQVQAGTPLDTFERPLIDKLIREGQFKPELVNRFDEIVLFRPLNEEELGLVANVMIRGINQTLSPQHISVELTREALQKIVHAGYDPEFGARPMRRVLQKTVENAVAVKILQGNVQPGTTITLDAADIMPEEHASSPEQATSV